MPESPEITVLVKLVSDGLDADSRAALETVDPLALIKSHRGGPPLPGWKAGGSERVIVDTSGRVVARDIYPAEGQHAIRHDPRRVLAAVAGWRNLLDEALGWEHHEADDPFYSCPASPSRAKADRAHTGPCDCGRDERVRAVLEALAAPYQGENHR